MAVRRIRDIHNGTFFSVVLTADQLPGTIRVVGGPTVAEMPAIDEVC